MAQTATLVRAFNSSRADLTAADLTDPNTLFRKMNFIKQRFNARNNPYLSANKIQLESPNGDSGSSNGTSKKSSNAKAKIKHSASFNVLPSPTTTQTTTSKTSKKKSKKLKKSKSSSKMLSEGDAASQSASKLAARFNDTLKVINEEHICENNESIRWTLKASTADEEEELLNIYKMNRRKRYIEQRNKFLNLDSNRSNTDSAFSSVSSTSNQ
jgi:hypothetical protein